MAMQRKQPTIVSVARFASQRLNCVADVFTYTDQLWMYTTQREIHQSPVPVPRAKYYVLALDDEIVCRRLSLAELVDAVERRATRRSELRAA